MVSLGDACNREYCGAAAESGAKIES